MKTPTAFVSYSYDDDEHRHWVAGLARKLRADGVDVQLDQWSVAPGGQLPLFMERAVRENDFVLVICTPRYKQRADCRKGGVGYEGDVMTAECLHFGNRDKFIPVLRRGNWASASPSWLLGSKHVDLRSEDCSAQYEAQYEELVRALHSVPPDLPELGVNWKLEASRAAEYLSRHHFSAHRGAILWFTNVTAIFGNDGYDDACADNEQALDAQGRARAEVEGVRRELRERSIAELGFGTSRSGYTWVMLVKSSDARTLNDVPWRHYPEGGSNNAGEIREAFDRLWSYWGKPFNDRIVQFCHTSGRAL